MKVLCAGDLFIGSGLLADAARTAMGSDVEIVEYATSWPDQPFGNVDGVREATGDPDALAELAADVDVILTHLAPVSKTVLRAAPQLRVVGITRGGPVNADLTVATECGVPVAFLPGRNLGAVAEFTIGLMIALPRGIVRSSAGMKQGHWDSQYFRRDRAGIELRAATVGLIGLGAVGLRVADLLETFGARVLGYDPYSVADLGADHGVELVELDGLLAESDIVSLHARLTDSTRRMINADTISRMKPGTWLVNTARGELVDQVALDHALESGHLAGAALDVFDPEPPIAGDPLIARSNVIATSHLAGASIQVATESAERVAREVAHYLQTGELAHCANPEVIKG